MALFKIENLQILKQQYIANTQEIHSLEDYLHQVVQQFGLNHPLAGHLIQQIETYQFINSVIKDFIEDIDGM